MTKLSDYLEYGEKYNYNVVYFWICGLLFMIIGFFGLVGNILNFTILLQPIFRNKVFYQLLIVMTCFDVIFIISYAMLFLTGYNIVCWTDYRPPIENIARRFNALGLSGSTYTTIMISIERYLALCHPFMKWRRNISIYLVTIAVIVCGYNFPYFFDLEYYMENGDLRTKYKSWNNETYRQRYYVWAVTIIENLIPLPTLVVLKTLILWEVKRSKIT